MNQKKIAEIANVSPSTVSKALSGSKEISQELSEKIKNIAVREGYFEEKAKIRSEKINKKNILVALICPEIVGSYYSYIISVIKNEVEKKGGQVAIYVYDFSEEKLANIMKMITYKNETDGIISFANISKNIKPSVPVVGIFKRHMNVSMDVVSSEAQEVMDDAVKYLVEMGHKNIGFIGEKLTEGLEINFKTALKNNHLNVNPNYIFRLKERFERAGYEAADEIVTYVNRPTAVIAAYDEIAMGFIHRLKKYDINVPEDISVMGINDVFYASFTQVPLTTVQVYKHQQVVRAVELLYDKIINKTNEIKFVKTGHEIRVRDTVKKLNEE